ncbi:MAG TPA: cold shock domain-containing protein [bacterium]|nr:cold shock domain-containing protein [bacterium]
MAGQLDRIEGMLRALCGHLGVRDLEHAVAPADAIPAENGARYTGVVSRFEHGWGFIECEAMNRNYFVHYSDIDGTGLRSLDSGETVSFEIGPGRDGRPKAVRVRREPAGQPSARAGRIEAIPRAARGNGDHRGLPQIEDEEEEAAQAESAGDD